MKIYGWSFQKLKKKSEISKYAEISVHLVFQGKVCHQLYFKKVALVSVLHIPVLNCVYFVQHAHISIIAINVNCFGNSPFRLISIFSMNANLSNQDPKIDSSSNIWQQFPPCKQPVRQGMNKSTPANPLIFNITIAKLCEIHNEAALLIRH